MSQQGVLRREGGGGKNIQVVQTSTSAFLTITAIIPFDNTIPQQGEGTEIITLAITPTSATNRLYISFTAAASTIGAASTGTGVGALFQDATADALASTFIDSTPAAAVSDVTTACFNFSMLAGTTSSTTFKIRGGVVGGDDTLWINGTAGAAVFGGVSSTTLTITEIAP